MLLLAALLTGTLAGAAVAKQDLVVELFYSSVWNDHSADVYTRDPVSIAHAAGNEQSGLVPSEASLTFQGRDQKMNPANIRSPLFGLIGRNTPIRISVADDFRFSGQVVSWKPRRAVKGDAWVHVVAGGWLRQLGQGDPPVDDPAYRYIIRQSPHAYWPLDDGPDAKSGAAAVGSSPMVVVFAEQEGQAQFGAGELAPWLDKGLQVSGGLFVAGLVGVASTAPATVDVARRAGRVEDFGSSSVFVDQAATEGAETYNYEIHIRNDVAFSPSVQLFHSTQGGFTTLMATSTDSAVQAAGWDDRVHTWRLQISQDGADVDVVAYLDGVSVLSATHVGATRIPAGAVRLVNNNIAAEPIVWGHAVFWDGNAPAASDVSDAVSGYRGEAGGDRFTRLCAQEGITSTIIGTASDTQPMGPQPRDTTLGLLAEIAATDNGLIFDTRSQLGLTFRTGRSLYNQ